MANPGRDTATRLSEAELDLVEKQEERSTSFDVPTSIVQKWRNRIEDFSKTKCSVKLVGFMGAGGTGKTTIANQLASKYAWTLLPSSSREVFKKLGYNTEADQNKLTVNERMTLQTAIADAYLTKFFNKLDTFDSDQQTVLMVDRMLYDHFIYMLLSCHEIMAESFTKYYNVMCYNFHIKFDLVLYTGFPPPFKSTNDDFRDPDYGKKLLFDGMMHRFISDSLLNNIVVVDQRNYPLDFWTRRIYELLKND